MLLREIETPITAVPGIGPQAAKSLANLDIFTVSDLLTHYPRDWEDRTETVPLAAAMLQQTSLSPKIHTTAVVEHHEWFGFGRMKTLKIHIRDKTARAVLVCFNRSFLEKTLPVNAVISVSGKFSLRYSELQSSSFEAVCIARSGTLEEYDGKANADSRVLPVYNLTANITQAFMRKAVLKALQLYARGIDNELPPDITVKYGFPPKKQVLTSLHNPQTLEEAQKARDALIYEELFQFQTAVVERYVVQKGKMPPIDTDEKADDSGELSGLGRLTDYQQNDAVTDSVHDRFIKSLSPRQKTLLQRLPFKLTPGQISAVLTINTDIDAGTICSAGTIRHAGVHSLAGTDCSAGIHSPARPQHVMARLLQGDVGSGKTLVAFFACLRIADLGGQCALLAPTELLARQHAENAASLLEPAGVSLAFLTGNVKSKGRSSLLSALENGDIDIVIGTHALFSQNVRYKNLMMAVIDEQHRFGVVQRSAIIEKGRSSAESGGSSPHVLMMSATPIPRTLALTVFGDLDVSTITSLPAGRKPILTHLTRMGNEYRVYEAVRSELKRGRQAYFVYPRIETAEDDEIQEAQHSFTGGSPHSGRKQLKSAEETFEYLSKHVYPEYSCALVHSKTTEEEQCAALDSFKKGLVNILVATSVVEVGVDVPNASCMVIEHAERFGLSALHQLRGRVGRGTEQSHCFLIYSDKLTETGKERLKVMHESTDGFLIAEKDMKLRGPGELTGIQQSGFLSLGIADPVRDIEILIKARRDVIMHLQKKSADQ